MPITWSKLWQPRVGTGFRHRIMYSWEPLVYRYPIHFLSSQYLLKKLGLLPVEFVKLNALLCFLYWHVSGVPKKSKIIFLWIFSIRSQLFTLIMSLPPIKLGLQWPPYSKIGPFCYSPSQHLLTSQYLPQPLII